MTSVFVHGLWRRRGGLLGWSIGVLALVALLAVAYPTVRDNSQLDESFAGLSPGVRQLLGLSAGAGLTSPVGYLNSQLFANLLPLMLLIFAVGIAAWCVAGDEAAGTLELLLANPISRARVAAARLAALVALLAVPTAVCAVGLLALAGPFHLDEGLPWSHVVAATGASALLALTYASLAFAVGAATGSRPVALAVASVSAVAGYLVEGLASAVRLLRPVRAVMPWHWLLHTDPLRHGLSWQAWVLPLLASAAFAAVGIVAFQRRDLR